MDYAKYIKDKNINFDYILAHSYGGKVAIEYYLNFEKKKLILLGPSIIKPHKSIWIKFKILIYKLRKKYNSNSIFSKKQDKIIETQNTQTQLIEYNESVFRKILNKIKKWVAVILH